MKTAVDIAEDFTDSIFEALARSDAVRKELPAGAVAKRRRHVIDSAGFDVDGSLMFDGEFDFHYGQGGDESGHPALRAHVQGFLEKGADGDWRVSRLQVESLKSVDAAVGPDELNSGL
jgi:hypothetical protein